VPSAELIDSPVAHTAGRNWPLGREPPDRARSPVEQLHIELSDQPREDHLHLQVGEVHTHATVRATAEPDQSLTQYDQSGLIETTWMT